MDSSQGLSLSTPEDVLNYVEEYGISSIRMWFTDMMGFLKSFSITPKELKGAFEEGMGFDGSSIEGYQRIQESDMVAVPIAPTAEVLPFRSGGSRTMRMFAEIRSPDGTPYAADPRLVLQRQLSRLEDHGYTNMYLGPEPEFFYFKSEKEPIILDQAGYFDINPVDIGDDIREVTVFALEAMGIPVEYHHAEVAPSQHEIDIRYQDALRMADSLQTHKYLVKEIARRCGVYATFMPKPLEGENGSGMHVHLSIFKNGTNAFYDQNDEHHLSVAAKQFIAGVLDHSRELAFVTNQWHNSYKRLVPGYEAPVYIAWAERNRSAAVRIPLYKPGKEVATRMELRFPDAACNPYFAFATMLAAGLDGVDRALSVPDPMTIDLYGITPIEREEMGIQALPHDLFEAVQVAEGSGFMKEVLGKDVHRKLVETKLNEVDEFRLNVSDLDLEKHLVL
ncbi:MAG: glutamine synthetase [Gemmatimonadetes bacterium]|nr:glutamine synthetase family protein [Gemmatimonadota bacterium]NNM04139.1 glutamine synthetase [Gemmatimonadota bacterium]